MFQINPCYLDRLIEWQGERIDCSRQQFVGSLIRVLGVRAELVRGDAVRAVVWKGSIVLKRQRLVIYDVALEHLVHEIQVRDEGVRVLAGEIDERKIGPERKH